MCVGERIKAYMDEKGIKQVFVSRKTGIPKEKLCSSLNGNRKLQFEEYELICGALDVNTDKFIKEYQNRSGVLPIQKLQRRYLQTTKSLHPKYPTISSKGCRT